MGDVSRLVEGEMKGTSRRIIFFENIPKVYSQTNLKFTPLLR